MQKIIVTIIMKSIPAKHQPTWRSTQGCDPAKRAYLEIDPSCDPAKRAFLEIDPRV
jgi:hypothetical protein